MAASSRNSVNQPVVSTSALILPRTVKPGTPIVVINDMINSLGRNCQPSYALTTREEVYRKQNERVYQEALVFIRFGYAVVLPDFLGSDSPYGANVLGGGSSWMPLTP